MIKSLFKFKYPEKVDDLKKSNYTIIRETADESLLSYIYANFKNYITEIVLGQDTNISEDIHAVEDILERLYKTNPEICKEVLDKENVIWNDLDDCCSCGDSEEDEKAKKVIWDYVLNNKMIVVSWNNFICYYENHKLTSALLSWLNEEIEQFMQDDQVEDVTDEVIKDMIIEDVSLEAFEKIIKKFRVNEFTNSLNEFTPEKIAIFVKEQYIPFSVNMLDEMKKVAPASVKEYIVYNKEKFFENLEDITLDLHVITQLLNANELDNNDKLKLFNLFDEEDTDKELALSIKELLFTVPKSYVEAAWEILDDGDRYQLFLNQLDVYSLDEISEKLSVLAPDYKNLSDRTKRHKEYLDDDGFGYNEKLLARLKGKDYLTSVDIETHGKEQKQRFAVWVKKK